MVDVYIAGAFSGVCKDLEQAHEFLISLGVTDDHVFEIKHSETGELLSHTHNGQLRR